MSLLGNLGFLPLSGGETLCCKVLHRTLKRKEQPKNLSLYLPVGFLKGSMD